MRSTFHHRKNELGHEAPVHIAGTALRKNKNPKTTRSADRIAGLPSRYGNTPATGVTFAARTFILAIGINSQQLSKHTSIDACRKDYSNICPWRQTDKRGPRLRKGRPKGEDPQFRQEGKHRTLNEIRNAVNTTHPHHVLFLRRDVSLFDRPARWLELIHLATTSS